MTNFFRDHVEDYPFYLFVIETIMRDYKISPALLAVDASQRPKNITRDEWVEPGTIYSNYCIVDVTSSMTESERFMKLPRVLLFNNGKLDYNKIRTDLTENKYYKYNTHRFIPIFASSN